MNLIRPLFHSSACRPLQPLLLHRRCLSSSSKPAGAFQNKPILSKLICGPPLTPLYFLSFQQFSSSRSGGDRMKEKKKKSKSGGGSQFDRPKVHLDDDEMERVLAFEELQEAAETAIAKLKVDLREQYNVRLNPRQIESLKVSLAEGIAEPVALADLATVSWNRSQLVINLASMPTAVKPVLRALHSSGLNLNPQTASGGNQSDPLIYIPLPKAVTTEHRQALVKAVQAAGQATKDRLKDRHFQKRFYHAKDAKSVKGIGTDLLADVAANLAYYIKEKCREVDVIVQAKVDSLEKGN